MEWVAQRLASIFGPAIKAFLKRTSEKTGSFYDLVEELDEALRHYAPAYANTREDLDDDDMLKEARERTSSLSRKLGSKYRAIPALYRRVLSVIRMLPKENDVREAERLLEGISKMAGSNNSELLIQAVQDAKRVRKILKIEKE